MKKHLLRILALLLFSLAGVHFMFHAFLKGNINELLPLKISPRTPTENNIPANKNKYPPQQLKRIYLFEHIHKSVEKGKKGITS